MKLTISNERLAEMLIRLSEITEHIKASSREKTHLLEFETKEPKKAQEILKEVQTKK